MGLCRHRGMIVLLLLLLLLCSARQLTECDLNIRDMVEKRCSSYCFHSSNVDDRALNTNRQFNAALKKTGKLLL
jgi:hypothetical protein